MYSDRMKMTILFARNDFAHINENEWTNEERKNIIKSSLNRFGSVFSVLSHFLSVVLSALSVCDLPILTNSHFHAVP